MEVAFRVDYVQGLAQNLYRKQAVVAGREGWTAGIPDEMSKGFLEFAKGMSRWL